MLPFYLKKTKAYSLTQLVGSNLLWHYDGHMSKILNFYTYLA